MEYFIYCDESEKAGEKFTNFYGGALVRSTHIEEVNERLHRCKEDIGVSGEMKWSKVTHQYLEKYKELMRVFFDLIAEDKVKMRVMFQQKERSEPRLRRLSKAQRDDSYFLLYYQFFKHAFGLPYSNRTYYSINLRIHFDQFPDTKEKVDRFKDYIHKLQYQRVFLDAGLKIRYSDIAEVTSHDHDVLQCADIVTGAMWFRLNNLHKVIPEGERVRGKRTRAKEELYNYINQRIREIRPRFNIGSSTGTDRIEDRFDHPYRHWLFIPNET